MGLSLALAASILVRISVRRGVAVLSEPEFRKPTAEQRARHRRPSSVPALFPFRRAQGGWRDPLRRRMLALADVAALLVGSLSLGLVFDSDVERAVWSIVVLPVW